MVCVDIHLFKPGHEYISIRGCHAGPHSSSLTLQVMPAIEIKVVVGQYYVKVQNQVALTCQVTSGPIVSIAENSEKVP